jgi:hypothetical protein
MQADFVGKTAEPGQGSPAGMTPASFARILRIYPEHLVSLVSMQDRAQHLETAGADPTGFMPRRTEQPEIVRHRQRRRGHAKSL